MHDFLVTLFGIAIGILAGFPLGIWFISRLPVGPKF